MGKAAVKLEIKVPSAEEMVATITSTWEVMHSLDMLNVLNMKILFAISIAEREKQVPFRRTICELTMTQIRSITRSFNSLHEKGFVYRIRMNGSYAYYLTEDGWKVVSSYARVYSEELARIGKVLTFIDGRRSKICRTQYLGHPHSTKKFLFRDRPIPKAYNLNDWEKEKKKFNRQNLKIKWKHEREERDSHTTSE